MFSSLSPSLTSYRSALLLFLQKTSVFCLRTQRSFLSLFPPPLSCFLSLAMLLSALLVCTWEFADTRYSSSPQKWSEHASYWKPQTLWVVWVYQAFETIKCVHLHMHAWLCLILSEISFKFCFLLVFWPKHRPFSIFHIISPIPNFRFRQYIWCFIFSAPVLHLNFLRLLSASCTVHKRFLQLNGFFLLMHIKHGCSWVLNYSGTV